KPLAAEMRPPRLDGIVGQTHLIGPNGSLRRSIKAGRIGTAILYGPSGTGKTTIARAVGAEMSKEFHVLHPAESSVADIRKVAAEAKVRDLLVFVD
ncbi:AAA family ATPase, partial [Enterobacter hormaechei]